jgi:RND family efflux transporter MFP subunit
MPLFPLRSRTAAAAVVLALLGAFSGPPARGQMGPSPVVLDAVRVEVAEQFRQVTGELRSVRRALLAAEEDGLVVELAVNEGDAVKQGDVLARLRDTRARLDVARAEADLASKRGTVLERTAEAARARQDMARLEELQSRASAAWSEMEDKKTALAAAEARLEVASADVASAEAALNWARERLVRMTIAAPFGGRIIAKRTEIGQWLRQGDPVVELLDLDQVDARLDVPEQFIDRINQSAEPVRIRIQATGEVAQAPVSAVVPDADPLSRLFPVRVRLSNGDGHLRPGMSIVGLVPTGSSRPTKTVRKDAIMRDDAGEYIYYDAGGRAAAARIRTLFPVGAGGERVAVESPMLPDDARVIVQGNERLFPGSPIAEMGGTAPAGPGAAPGSKDAGQRPRAEPGTPPQS